MYLPYEFVQVEHVEIIQGLLAIPAAKDVQEVAHLVAGVRCPATEIYSRTLIRMSPPSNKISEKPPENQNNVKYLLGGSLDGRGVYQAIIFLLFIIKTERLSRLFCQSTIRF